MWKNILDPLKVLEGQQNYDFPCGYRSSSSVKVQNIFPMSDCASSFSDDMSIYDNDVTQKLYCVCVMKQVRMYTMHYVNHVVYKNVYIELQFCSVHIYSRIDLTLSPSSCNRSSEF